MMLTQSALNDVLSYDPDTGVFVWRVMRGGKPAGSIAGYKATYQQVGVGGKLYLGHRLAWLYMTGGWPDVEIDHINGDRTDNRWVNLRHANRAENNQNHAMRSDNKSGFKGVWWNKANRNWSSQIQVGGKRHCLGNYPTAEEAYAAYLAAKRDLHTFQPIPRYEAQAA